MQRADDDVAHQQAFREFRSPVGAMVFKRVEFSAQVHDGDLFPVDLVAKHDAGGHARGFSDFDECHIFQFYSACNGN